MADDLVLPEGFEIEGTGGRAVAPRADPGRRVYINEPSSGTSLTMPEGFEVVSDQPTWLSAITEIPKEIYRAGADAVGHIADLGKRGEQGPIEGLMTTGRAALAVPELLLSPLTGTARSLIGHPMAQLEHAAGTVIAPEIAARDDLRKMFETSRGDVDLATAALRPHGAPIKGVVPPIPGPVPVPGPGVRANLPEAGAFERAAGRPQWIWDRERVPRAPADIGPEQDLIASAGRVAETTGRPIEVPTAMASDNMAIQRAGQGLRNVPFVGNAIPKATGRLVGQLDEATGAIANEYGAGTGPNVVNRIGRDLEAAAEAERAAATAAAQRSDDALLAAWQREQDLANQNITGREAGAAQQARAAVGDMSPQDMGQALIARLRAGEAEARANKEALYGRAGNIDATVKADEVSNVHTRVRGQLETEGIIADDPELTRAANLMMRELERLANLQIGARSPPGGGTPIGVSAEGIEQARKRLVFFRSGATNDADRRAASAVMRHFDDWQSNAFETALLSGDETALRAFREARSANTEWRRRFFNDENEADKLINRIVTQEVTPQEIANLIVGSGQVGAKGVASKLLTRLDEITGSDPEALQAIRGGIWNKLSQTPKKIEEFLTGSGRDVANRLFSAEQRGIMRTYGETLRTGQEARQTVADVSKTTKPQAMAVGPGPIEDLAKTVLGRGGKTDEALFNAIMSYGKSGNRGDIQTLAKLVGSIPAEQKGDLVSAIVRNLGVGAEGFSPDIFATNWSGSKGLTPQAKAILFGNAGSHLKALDDIATISLRMKQTARRFGNPSGTAQNVNIAGLIGWGIAEPVSAISTAVGGTVAAHILSRPATAVSAAKWARAYAVLGTRPSVQSIAAYQTASRNLANTANAFGSNVSMADFMKLLQAPSRSAAEDQNQVPRPPGQ